MQNLNVHFEIAPAENLCDQGCADCSFGVRGKDRLGVYHAKQMHALQELLDSCSEEEGVTVTGVGINQAQGRIENGVDVRLKTPYLHFYMGSRGPDSALPQIGEWIGLTSGQPVIGLNFAPPFIQAEEMLTFWLKLFASEFKFSREHSVIGLTCNQSDKQAWAEYTVVYNNLLAQVRRLDLKPAAETEAPLHKETSSLLLLRNHFEFELDAFKFVINTHLRAMARKPLVATPPQRESNNELGLFITAKGIWVNHRPDYRPPSNQLISTREAMEMIKKRQTSLNP